MKTFGLFTHHLYEFPMAVITNYHKLGVINNKILFSHRSGGQKSKSVSQGQKQGVSCTMFSLKVLGENIFLPSLVPAAACIPWLVPASLQSLPAWSHCLFLFCLKFPSTSFLKDICDCIEFLPP